MQIDAALVKEQGVHFAVVTVKPHVVQSTMESRNAAQWLSRYFPGTNIVLTDGHQLRGRQDIIRFVSRVGIRALPWKRFTIDD